MLLLILPFPSSFSGNGTCKHLVALLFALEDFVLRHMDRGTLVGTDVACKWDKPRQQSRPRRVTQFPPSAKRRRIQSSQTPYVPACLKNPEQLTTDWMDLMAGEQCLAVHILPIEDQTNLTTMKDLVQEHASPGMPVCKVMEKIQDHYSEEFIQEIEQKTRGQSQNECWFQQRIGRITGTTFSSASRCAGDGDYIVKKVMGLDKKFHPTAHMLHGTIHESVARQLYVEKHLSTHIKGLCHEPGLILCMHNPRYAASPDGLISCKCCGEGLLEIKCTSKYKNLTVQEVALQDYEFIPDDSGQPKLKENSKWFDQVQAQLFVCNKEWCDFVLFTLNGPISVERIFKDGTWIVKNIQKVDEFYDTKIFPLFFS